MPSPAQRRVLVELCRPLRDGLAAPASTDEIASALNIAESSVKTHLKNLYALYGMGSVGGGRKRVELARLVLDEGIVRRGDL